MSRIIPTSDLSNNEEISKIDQAIYEAEEEMSKVAEAMDADEAFASLDKKYYG